MRRLEMDDTEIVNSYRTAKDPAAQIKILAQLNAATEKEIWTVLERNEIPRMLTKKERSDKTKALYEQGLTDTEIAREMGIARVTVCQWRKRLGLPPNVKAAKDEPAGPERRTETAPDPIQETEAPDPVKAEARDQAPPESQAMDPSRLDKKPPSGRLLEAAVILGGLIDLIPEHPSMRVRSAVENFAAVLVVDCVEATLRERKGGNTDESDV